MVDPQTKRETADERVIAVKEGPLRMEFSIGTLGWFPNVLEGARGLGESDD